MRILLTCNCIFLIQFVLKCLLVLNFFWTGKVYAKWLKALKRYKDCKCNETRRRMKKKKKTFLRICRRQKNALHLIVFLVKSLRYFVVTSFWSTLQHKVSNRIKIKLKRNKNHWTKSNLPRKIKLRGKKRIFHAYVSMKVEKLLMVKMDRNNTSSFLMILCIDFVDRP